jgi:hypothetical protein
MGAVTRVPKWRDPNTYVAVEAGATVGAHLGENFWLNGVLVRPEDILNIYATPDGSPQFPITYWRNLQEIPPNIVALAALDGAGYPYRQLNGTWALRKSGRAVVNFAFGDATPSPIYIPAETGVLALLRVEIETPFDGTGAELTIGTESDPDAYVDASQVDPAVVASWEVCPDITVTSGSPIVLYITPGAGASTGTGRILIELIPTAES